MSEIDSNSLISNPCGGIKISRSDLFLIEDMKELPDTGKLKDATDGKRNAFMR